MTIDLYVIHPDFSRDGERQNIGLTGSDVAVLNFVKSIRRDFIKLKSIFLLYWNVRDLKFPDENKKDFKTKFVDSRDFDNQISTWKFTAANQAIYEIWSFSQKIHFAINSKKWDFHNTSEQILENLEWVHSELEALFPSIKGLRDSIAHRNDMMGKKETILKEDLSLVGGKFIMNKGGSLGESLINDVFCLTRGGEVIKLDMGEKSITGLISIYTNLVLKNFPETE